MNTKAEITDVQLVKIKARDRKTIESIYKESYPMVQKYILKNSGTEADAQDIFQDAFYLLMKKIENPAFTITSKVSTYIFGISKNLWLKVLTQKSVNIENLRIEQSINEDFEDTNTQDFGLVKRMHKCLFKIGEPCKTILEQFYFLKTSMKEIAEMLHYTNANNAKNQKYKCFMRLRKLMIERKK